MAKEREVIRRKSQKDRQYNGPKKGIVIRRKSQKDRQYNGQKKGVVIRRKSYERQTIQWPKERDNNTS